MLELFTVELLGGFRCATFAVSSDGPGVLRDRWDGGNVYVDAFHSLFALRICIQSGKLRS